MEIFVVIASIVTLIAAGAALIAVMSVKSELRKMNGEIYQNMTRSFSELRGEIGAQLAEDSARSEYRLDGIRDTVEKRVSALQDENRRQLDQMRATVDEKLQKTLEERIGQSFRLVNERLEQVYKGLGEMQSLAAGVGDLKKVLSNVKTRGILGEMQLASILEQILSSEQYEENLMIRNGARVEFAVKLPGDGEQPVFLPIDAKFPSEAYARLIDASEAGDVRVVTLAKKELEQAIKTAAKDISEKYIDPPFTTDFAIMFLPIEGLYAEVIRMGMLESLQNSYRVSVAGPTTMAAMLNSLQMGFRTLAIQKRTGEVWKVLGAVKTEFGRFEDVLTKAQKRILQVNDDLDKLVGARSRMISRRLRDVSELELSEAEKQLTGGATAAASTDESGGATAAASTDESGGTSWSSSAPVSEAGGVDEGEGSAI
ncbi:MAG: DNA recombination protein RmuC [Clostridiales Family XIII bacterium]|jgi:DNA recombination protein RmuC|nr:DNA recombination protein RmuC [Clostridiales Family XIII bacterium]